MRSKEFFGNWKFKDIHVIIYNEKNEPIYKEASTTFAHANPTIQKEIDDAIEDYRKHWKYEGEPRKVEIFTTPNYKKCTYDVLTKKKTFENI